MKKTPFMIWLVYACLLFSHSSFAQGKDQEQKADQFDEIIIKKKSDRDSKVTIEIKNGEVTVNGKPLSDYEDENTAVIIRKMPYLGFALPNTRFRQFGTPGEWELIQGDSMPMNKDEQGFLGVSAVTEAGSTLVQAVTENSAASKAGLKKGDIILKVDAAQIESPADLSRVISTFKPEEEVTITFKRDGKTATTKAKLGKRPIQNINRIYRFRNPNQPGPLPGMEMLPDLENLDFYWKDGKEFFPGDSDKPRLGIKAQDPEDGKGVAILEITRNSAAEKAGLQSGDRITHYEGRAVNSADELVDAVQQTKDKSTVKIDLLRNGKKESVEIKLPRKLKTANL